MALAIVEVVDLDCELGTVVALTSPLLPALATSACGPVSLTCGVEAGERAGLADAAAVAAAAAADDEVVGVASRFGEANAVAARSRAELGVELPLATAAARAGRGGVCNPAGVAAAAPVGAPSTCTC